MLGSSITWFNVSGFITTHCLEDKVLWTCPLSSLNIAFNSLYSLQTSNCVQRIHNGLQQLIFFYYRFCQTNKAISHQYWECNFNSYASYFQNVMWIERYSITVVLSCHNFDLIYNTVFNRNTAKSWQAFLHYILIIIIRICNFLSNQYFIVPIVGYNITKYLHCSFLYVDFHCSIILCCVLRVLYQKCCISL